MALVIYEVQLLEMYNFTEKWITSVKVQQEEMYRIRAYQARRESYMLSDVKIKWLSVHLM